MELQLPSPVSEQEISRDTLLEKYAKGSEQTVTEVRRRVARALAQVEREGERAQWERRFLQAQEEGFIPAGRINSAAGVMGKMISPLSIAVAVAATGMTSADESKLFRFTIKHSILLMTAMGVISMLFAYVFPGHVPVVAK